MNAEDPIPHSDDQLIVERSKLPEEPGTLRGQVWLTIQTRQAQQLIRGRNGTHNKPAIIGLVGFADRLRVIWQAARNDDPYADWWLIKIHEAIDASSTFIHNRQTDLDSQLEQITGLEVTIAGSLRPYRVPLQFVNPYAYRGARLLSEYDTLVCTVLTARHIGLLDSETSEGLLKACGRKIRSAFSTPQGYRFTGIDRESLRRGGGKSNGARQAMGEVPNEVLSGERHAPLIPRKVRFPAAFVEHGELRSASLPSNASQPDDENHGG